MAFLSSIPTALYTIPHSSSYSASSWPMTSSLPSSSCSSSSSFVPRSISSRCRRPTNRNNHNSNKLFVNKDGTSHQQQKQNYSAQWIDLLSPETYLRHRQEDDGDDDDDIPPPIPIPGHIYPPRSGAVSFSTMSCCDGSLFTFGGYAEVESSSSSSSSGVGGMLPVDRFAVNDLWQFMPYSEKTSPSLSWGWNQVHAATTASNKIDYNENNNVPYIPGPRLATAMALLPRDNSNINTHENVKDQAVLFGGWDPQIPGTGGVILEDVSILSILSAGDDDSSSSSSSSSSCPKVAMQWSEVVMQTNENKKEEVAATIPGGPTSRHVAVSLCIRDTTTTTTDADATGTTTDAAADNGNEETTTSYKNMILLHNHRCDDHVLLFSTSSSSPPAKTTTATATTATATATATIGKIKGQWKKQPTLGNAPSSRGLHCAAPLVTTTTTTTTTDDDSTIDISKGVVLFGGAAQEGCMSNEAFVLDVETWRWTKLDCTGDEDGGSLPSPRAGACLCPMDEHSVLLFGGAKQSDGGGLVGLNDVWVLRVDMEHGKGKWQCLIPNKFSDDDGDGNDGSMVCPPGRNAATLTKIDANALLPKDVLGGSEQTDVYFLLQGGWYPFRKTYDDVFLLRVSSDVAAE